MLFFAQRIDATKTLMTDVKGTANHMVVSKVQAGALAEMIQSVNSVLTHEARAHLSCEAVTIEWFNTDHCTAVVAAFDRPGSGKKKERRDSQDYLNIHLYGHEHFWRALTSSENVATSKLQLVCNLGMALGLRLPSEHTMKWMTSLWLCTSHSIEALASLPEDAKGVYIVHVKKSWASMKAKSGTPTEWIHKLPCDPLDCCRDFPQTFVAMFPGGIKPVNPPPIDIHAVMAFDQTYGCRGGKTKTQSAVPGWMEAMAAPRLATSPKKEATGFEKMASQMMAHQTRILELVLGSGGSTGSMQPLRSMSSITDLLAIRAAASGQPTNQLALTDGSIDSQHASQIVRAGSVGLDSERDEVTPVKAEVTPGKAEAPSPAPVTADIEALLKSLSERKKSNAIKAASMKKPAAAADADDADEACGDQTAPARKRARVEEQALATVGTLALPGTKAKAKAKAKAAAPPTVDADAAGTDAAGKIPKAKANATGKSMAAAGPNVEAEVAAATPPKAPPKAKAKAKEKAKAAAPLIADNETAGTPPTANAKAKGRAKMAAVPEVAAEVAASPPQAKREAKASSNVSTDAKAKANAMVAKLTDDEKAAVSMNRRMGIAAQPWCAGRSERGVKVFGIQRHSRGMAKIRRLVCGEARLHPAGELCVRN